MNELIENEAYEDKISKLKAEIARLIEVRTGEIKLPPEGKRWSSLCRDREWWIEPEDSWEYMFWGKAMTNPPEDKKASLIKVIEFEAVRELVEALTFYRALSNIPLGALMDKYAAGGSTYDVFMNYTSRARKALARLPKELVK